MNAETLAIFLAGLVAPWITNAIKGGKIEGKAALWLSFVVSLGLAVTASAATGDLADMLSGPDALAARVGPVFALATLIYKQFVADQK